MFFDVAAKTPFIIVVDDEEPVSEVIEAHIANRGYRERSFVRPDEALGYFEKNLHDIHGAIIDLTLPGISGVELAYKFLQMKPDLCTILVTGHPPESLSPDQKAHFYRIIYKPFTKADIIEAVDSIIGKVCAVS